MPKKESQINTLSTIKCCHYCKAPKRSPGCHDRCPEYQKEKAEYEERKAAYFGKKDVSMGLTAQRTASVTKALRDRRNSYRHAGKGRFAK